MICVNRFLALEFFKTIECNETHKNCQALFCQVHNHPGFRFSGRKPHGPPPSLLRSLHSGGVVGIDGVECASGGLHAIVNGEKQRLKVRTQEACGVEINGLAGLYCYFLGLSHAWMTNGCLAGWLIPSEFMDVNYGASVKGYLLDKVMLLHIHRSDPSDVQFGDALVSSAVVWFRKEAPTAEHEVRFTYGGSLERPKLERLVPVETLRRDPKWTRYPMKESFDQTDAPVLGDFFKIKRELATGNNSYFILSAEEIERRELPMEAFKPILPSPRYLPDDEVVADKRGNPVLERRSFLLDCQLEEDEVRRRYPKLWAYLEEGKAQGVPKRYLCRHRTPWYTQENRPPPPFVCTYLGRSDTKSGRPFRFILNNSRATAANVYLVLYPKGPIERALKTSPALKRKVWKFLNEISPLTMPRRSPIRARMGGRSSPKAPCKM